MATRRPDLEALAAELRRALEPDGEEPWDTAAIERIWWLSGDRFVWITRYSAADTVVTARIWPDPAADLRAIFAALTEEPGCPPLRLEVGPGDLDRDPEDLMMEQML